MSVKLTVCKRTIAFCLTALAIFSIGCSHVHATDREVLGTVPWLLTATGEKNAQYLECSLGDAVADAVRSCTDADLAVVRGGDLIGNLQPGEADRDALAECIAADKTIGTVQVTAGQLYRILEDGVSCVLLTEKGAYDPVQSENPDFLQVSGFYFYYDPTGQSGSRVTRLVIDGEPVESGDNTTLYRMAATQDSLSRFASLGIIEEYAMTEQTLTDAMAEYLQRGLDDYSIPPKRVVASGMKTTLLSGYTLVTVLAVGAIFVFLITMTQRRFKRYRDDREQQDEESIPR